MKNYFNKATFIALLIPIFIYSCFSLLALPKLNSIFQQVLFHTTIGEKIKLIQPAIVEDLKLTFLDTFLILNYVEPNYLISYDIYSLDGHLQLGFSFILILAIIAFIPAGYYLGKKKQTDRQIVLFSILFGLLPVILSLFVKNNYLSDSVGFIHIELNYQANFVVFILSSIFTYFGFALATKDEKDQFILSPLKVILLSISFYFAIVSAFLVVAFGMIRERLLYMFPNQPLTEYIQLSVELITTLASQVATYIFSLSHFIPITIVSEDNGVLTTASFSIQNGMELNGEFSIGLMSLFVIRDLLNKVPYDEYLVYLSLLPIILIFISGYKAKSSIFCWNKILNFTFFYTVISISIMTICNFELHRFNLISKESNHLYFDIQLWKSILMFVLISFTSYTAGHFSKHMIKRR